MIQKKDRIEDLRDLLFQTLDKLLDPENPMDVAQAKSVANIARVMVDSAKVEVELMKILGGEATGSGFIPLHKRLQDNTPPALSEAATG